MEKPIKSQPIKSPCNLVCTINPANDLCMGCNRTLEEIAKWRTYSDKERDEIMAILPKRENQFQAG